MKNVFYLREDSETGEIDGAPLIDRRVSEEISQKWEAYYEEEDDNDENATHALFSLKQVLGMITALLCLIPTILLINYAERTESDLLLLVAILIALPSMITFLILIRQCNRSRVTLADVNEEKKELLWKETLEDFCAPTDAARIDVLDYDPEMPETCLLLEKAVFWDGDRLCFADEDYRVSLYRDAIRRLCRITGKLSVIGWNKPTPAGKGIYADVKTKQFNAYLPGYAVLEFTEGGEDYGIWIPYYDVPTVEALIGMMAEDEL